MRGRARLRDGRVCVLLVLMAYFSVVLFATIFTDYHRFWRNYLWVDSSNPPFFDLHNITSALECHRLGYDVVVRNPCDPGGRPMSYPRAWLALSGVGIDQSHTFVLGILSALVFYLSVFFVIRPSSLGEVLYYGAVLCSPAVVLGVETGNTDLLVFSLLALALFLMESERSARLGPYVVIFLAGILKLFPIAALAAALKERKDRALLIFGIGLLGFAGYVLLIFPDLMSIHRLIGRSTYISYGSFVAFRILQYSSGIGHDISATHLRILAASAAVFCVGCCGLPSLLMKRTPTSRKHIDSFRVGASIYVATFILWDNWDYRLAFLIFTLPQILSWAREEGGSLTWLSRAAAGGIVLTLWLSARWPYAMQLREPVNRFWADEAINWLLLAFYSHTLARTLPDWMRARRSRETPAR